MKKIIIISLLMCTLLFISCGSKEKGEDAAKDFLTGYTSDFFGATIVRWDEMTREYWIQSRFGL